MAKAKAKSEQPKRSAAMHAYQQDYAAWKARGKVGPEPARPKWDEDAKRAAGKGRFRREAA